MDFLTSSNPRSSKKKSAKPAPGMLRGILNQHKLQPGQLAMVGDRLYTDVVMAQHLGALAVLVLSGEATEEPRRSRENGTA